MISTDDLEEAVELPSGYISPSAGIGPEQWAWVVKERRQRELCVLCGEPLIVGPLICRACVGREWT